MTRLKWFISILLVLPIACILMGVKVSALSSSDGVQYDSATGFYFEGVTSGIALLGFNTDTKGTNVTIPNTLNVGGTDYPVTEIGYSSYSYGGCVADAKAHEWIKLTLDSFVIPEDSNLKKIDIRGSGTDDTVLTVNGDVTFPKYVQAIYDVRLKCNTLTINSRNITSVNYGGFQYLNCENLVISSEVTNFNYLESGYRSCFQSTLSGCGMTVSDTLTIAGTLSGIDSDTSWSSFSGAKLNKVIFESTCNLNRIPASFFEGVSSLNSVTLSPLMTSIGNNAFKNCAYLSEILGATNITSIGASAFSGCSSFTNLIPWLESLTNLETLGNSAFEGCNFNNKSIDLSGTSLVTIGSNCFKNTGLVGLTLPATVETLGNDCFLGCSLTSFNFNDLTSLKTIGNNVFKGTIAATNQTFVLPATLTSIGENAFYNFNGTNKVDIFNIKDLTVFNKYCFYGARVTKFNDVLLSKNLTFDDYCFSTAVFDYTASDNLVFVGNCYFKDGCFKDATLSVNVLEFSGDTEIYCSFRGNYTGCFSSNGTIKCNKLYIHDCSFFTSEVNFASDYTGEFLFKGLDCETVVMENLTKFDYIGHSMFENSTVKNFIFSMAPDKYSNVTFELCFYQCSNLETVDMRGLGVIYTPFYNCPKLKTIHLDVREVYRSSRMSSHSAIYDCPALTSLIFSERLEILGEGALQDISVSTLDFSHTQLRSIGGSGLRNLKNLTSISFPNTLKSMGDYCLAILNSSTPNALTSVIIPDSVTSIGEGAFSYRTNLESVHYSENMTYIPESCFTSCKGLTTINLSNITHVYDYGFSSCNSLASIDLSNVLHIGISAFESSGLTDINTDLRNVTFIGNYAFRGQGKLKIPIRLESITELGVAAFNACGITSAYVGPTLTKLNYRTQYSARYSETFAYSPNLKTIEFDCPQIVDLYQYFARGCTALETVKISSPLNRIDLYTFEGCNKLSTFEAPNAHILEILQSAFADCTSLQRIDIPVDKLKKIGSSAFSDSGLSEFDFESSVLESIDNRAFKNTKLTSVKLPKTIKRLSEDFLYSPVLSYFEIHEDAPISSLGYRIIGTEVDIEIHLNKAMTTFSGSVTGNGSYTFNIHSPAKITKLVFPEGCHMMNFGENPIRCDIDEIVNLPLYCATLSNFMTTNSVSAITFDMNSTCQTISDSFKEIKTNITLPPSVKRIQSTVKSVPNTSGTASMGTDYYRQYNELYNKTGFSDSNANFCFQTYGGTSLDLSNVEYIGTSYSGYVGDSVVWDWLYNNRPANIFVNCPNLTSCIFGDDITCLNGFYNVSPSFATDLRGAASLQTIVGFCNTPQLDGSTWIPNTVTGLYGVWMDSSGTITIPYGVATWLGTPHFVTGTNNTYYLPKTLKDIRFLRQGGNYIVEEEGILEPVGTGMLKYQHGQGNSGYYYTILSNARSGLASMTSNEAKIYFKDSANYTTHENYVKKPFSDYTGHIDTDTTRYGIQCYRYRCITSMDMSVSSDSSGGIYLYANLNTDVQSPAGTVVLYTVDNNDNKVEVARQGSSAKNLTFSILQPNIPVGATTYRAEFIPGSGCFLNPSSAEVGYVSSAVPVTITNFEVDTNELANGYIYLNATVQGAKFPRGELKFYHVTDAGRIPISSYQVEITEPGETGSVTKGATVDIDGNYMNNGDNTYLVEFISENTNAWYSAIPQTVNYNFAGSLPTLTLVASTNGGGVNVTATIESDALARGSLAVYLGTDRFGELLTLDGNLVANVTPDKLTLGENHFYAVYESNSALWKSTTANTTFDYNPTVITLDFNVNEEPSGVTLLIAPSDPNATGTLNLYRGDDRSGALITTSDTGVIQQFIARNNPLFDSGVNKMYAEFMPNTVSYSYASANNVYVKSMYETKITCSALNWGNYVKLVCRVMDDDGNLLDPTLMKVYLGPSEDGVCLNGSTISDGTGATVDCIVYDMNNMTATATIPKNELFAGVNEFYIAFDDPNGVYASSHLYKTYELDASGNPVIRNEGFTAEDIENLFSILASIKDGQEINFTQLILAINELSTTLDGDLKKIADFLEELANNGGSGGSTGDMTEVVEALDNIVNNMGTTWTLYVTADGDEYYAPEPKDPEDEPKRDENGVTITKTVTESEILGYLKDVVESTGVKIVDSLDDFLSEIEKMRESMDKIEETLDETNKTLEEIKDLLGDDFKEYFDTLADAVSSSSVDMDLSELIDALRYMNNNGGGITSSQLDELINAIRNGNSNKFDELINTLKNSVNTQGIEDKLDELITQIGESNKDVTVNTDDLESVLNEINNNLSNANNNSSNDNNNNDEDMKEFLDSLIDKINTDGNTTQTMDKEFLEDLMKSLEASINRGGSTDTTALAGVLERIAKSLESGNLGGSKLDTSGLEAILQKYYQPVNYEEIAKMLEKAGSGNKVDTSRIESALAGLSNSIKNNSITPEQVQKLIDTLDSLDKRFEEGLKIEGLDKLDAVLLALEDASTNREFKLDSEAMDLLKQLANKQDESFWDNLPLPIKVLLISFFSVGIASYVIASINNIMNIRKMKMDMDEVRDQTRV